MLLERLAAEKGSIRQLLDEFTSVVSMATHVAGIIGVAAGGRGPNVVGITTPGIPTSTWKDAVSVVKSQTPLGSMACKVAGEKRWSGKLRSRLFARAQSLCHYSHGG